MRFIAYILAFCLGTSALVVLALPGIALEALLGMLLPLGLGVATLILVRLYRNETTRLTATLALAFLVKMLVCALYVGLVVGVFSFKPVPFVVSFAAYYIVLHMAEALYLRSFWQTRWENQ